MARHRGAPLYMIKNQLMNDFEKWCNERTERMTPINMIEFLIQENLIQGKQFLKYCDEIEIRPMWGLNYVEPKREGFIPPQAWIGKRK